MSIAMQMIGCALEWSVKGCNVAKSLFKKPIFSSICLFDADTDRWIWTELGAKTRLARRLLRSKPGSTSIARTLTPPKVRQSGNKRRCDYVTSDDCLHFHCFTSIFPHFPFFVISLFPPFFPTFLLSFYRLFVHSCLPSFLPSFFPSFLSIFFPSFLSSFLTSFFLSRLQSVFFFIFDASFHPCSFPHPHISTFPYD